MENIILSGVALLVLINAVILYKVVRLERNMLFDANLSKDDLGDDLYDEAVELVTETGKASAPHLQRQFNIGYARACGLMDLLEMNEIIEAGDDGKPRKVIKQD